MRSSLTCPLVAVGKPVGFVFFSSQQPNTYRDLHVEVFLEIAGQLSTTVEKSRLYQRLVELNELKNRFLGVAAHDLRNPLGAIQTYLKMFLDGFFGDMTEEQREVMTDMALASDTMLNLVNDLLDISAIEAGHLELETRAVDLGDFLRECHRANRLIAEAKSIDLTLDTPDGLPAVELDARRIGQVLSNLLTNAVKFSHPGTTVTLTARTAGDSIDISVSDQGQGIPENDLPKLFTEFGRASVKPTAGEKSTGLGLAIVKRIVDAHGGAIRVDSEVGKGSTFTVTLPTRFQVSPEPHSPAS
jgi:signal transduction histidine kinase